MPGELQGNRERDQVLVHAVVQITLDHAAVGIRGQDEPLPCCAQLLDLDAQSIELLLHVDLPSLQFDRPPSLTAESCPSSPCRRQVAQHPLGREGSLLRTRLPPP